MTWKERYDLEVKIASPTPIFYLLSWLFGIAASFLTWTAHFQLSEVSVYKAKQIEAAFKQHVQYVQDHETFQRVMGANLALFVGQMSLILASLFVIAAFFRRERGCYVMLFTLVVFAVMGVMIF
jgi:hypothetical protein